MEPRTLSELLHDERTARHSQGADCWACEAVQSPALAAAIERARIEGGVAVLDAIMAKRVEAEVERVALHERGEPLTDYSSGVLDGLDRAWLAGCTAAQRPDERPATSPEEWWACERAYLAGFAAGEASAAEGDGRG